MTVVECCVSGAKDLILDLLVESSISGERTCVKETDDLRNEFRWEV